MTKLISYAPVDSACDQLSKHYIHDSLPPVLSEGIKVYNIDFGQSLKLFYWLFSLVSVRSVAA